MDDIDSIYSGEHIGEAKVNESILDLPLIDAHTGKPATLRKHMVENYYTLVTAVRHSL